MRPIKKGSVDQSVVIRILDSTDSTPETGVVAATSGLDLQYRRELEASVALTESDLAALTTAHSDGGIKHIGNGYYRVDLPDAAVATGANGVLVHGTVTGMVVVGVYVPLVDHDPYDAASLGLARLDASVSSRSSHTAANVRTEMDANSTKLANLDATISSRLAAAGYTPPDNAGITSAASSASTAASNIALVKTKTDNLPADPASNTQVNTRAAPGDAMALTAGERTTLLGAIFGFATEGTETFLQALRLMRAALVGKCHGFPAGPSNFRDAADSKNRITATHDADGNRTAVSTDAN